MSAVSLPVTRPTGQALVVGNPDSRAEPLATLASLGYACNEADDPYTAFAELCLNTDDYQAAVFCLGSLYREELAVIGAIKRRLPSLEVWLAQTDGRQSALAEALSAGADGLLSLEGMVRIALPPVADHHAAPHAFGDPTNHQNGDVVLTAVPAGADGPATVDQLPSRLRIQPGQARHDVHDDNLGDDREDNRNDTHGDRGIDHHTDPYNDNGYSMTEPLLTAEELRALLQEDPREPM